MTDDAADAELREIRKLWDEMQYIRTGAINALFAHIDAQAAEVERLKEKLREAIPQEYDSSIRATLMDENVSLRDLVQEADVTIRRYRYAHEQNTCTERLMRCDICIEADDLLAKAAKV